MLLFYLQLPPGNKHRSRKKSNSENQNRIIKQNIHKNIDQHSDYDHIENE